MSEWISAKKKPKSDTRCLILLKDGEVAIAGYQKNEDFRGWFDDFDEEYEPTYWMPIPEAPK